MNPLDTIFWIDAGSCRESQYDNIQFPTPARILSAVPPSTNGAMIFAAQYLFQLHRPAFVRIFREDFAIGTFFGGDHRALREYSVGF
jgi:hypothetical protein